MKTLNTKFRNNNTLIALCITVLIAIVTFNVSAQTNWSCYSGNVQTLYNGYQPGNAGNFTIASKHTNVPLQYQYKLYAPCKKTHTVYNNSGNGNNIQNTEVLRVGDDNFVYNGSTESIFKAASSAHWAVLKARKYFMDETPFQGFSIGSNTLNVITNNNGMETDLHFVGGVNLLCGKKNGKDYVSLDMIGRQYAKYVVNYKTGFGYNNNRTLTQDNEDGAMLESFGDIFGTMIERDVEGSGFNWLIGEDMSTIRNMANPSSMGHPDTYEGNNWSNSNDRYINCNVMNYWFYLLAQGGSGTNDKGDSYNVQGIGINNAMEIVYKTFTTLHNSHGFSGIATKTLQNAAFLFDNNSNEYIQACNAWYAVGVGNAPCATANPIGGNPGGGNVGGGNTNNCSNCTGTLHATNSVNQPNGFAFSFTTNGYQSGEQFHVRIIDRIGALRYANSFNTATWTHPINGNVTIGMNAQILNTYAWAHGNCHIFLFDQNNDLIDTKVIRINSSVLFANINTIGNVTNPNGFSVDYSSTYNQVGLNNSEFTLKVYDGNNILQDSLTVAGASGTFTIPNTTNYLIGDCNVELYDQFLVLMDSAQFILEESLSINCESYATNTGSLWIDSIGLGDIQNQTGDDDGFADYTHVSTVLTDGMEITLNPGFNVAPQLGMFWNIWIDFNQDGDFEDNGELAFQTEQHAFLRGDANDDGQVNMSDMIFIYTVLFQGGGNFANEDAADVNDDGMINITDGVFLSNYLFAGTVSALPEPFLTPGIDPTPDNLGIGSLTGTINIPIDVIEGETKMRIQLKYGSFTSDACEVYTYGEVEDYTVELAGGGNKMMAGDEDNNTIDTQKEEEMVTTTVMEDPEELELLVKAYPNPATAFLNIQVEGGLENSFSYQVIDLAGQLVSQQTDVYGQSARIDVSQLPKGIYMVMVQAGTQQITNKVIVR